MEDLRGNAAIGATGSGGINVSWSLPIHTAVMPLMIVKIKVVHDRCPSPSQPVFADANESSVTFLRLVKCSEKKISRQNTKYFYYFIFLCGS